MYINLTIFQRTKNLILPLKMTSEIVESTWTNIVFFDTISTWIYKE